MASIIQVKDSWRVQIRRKGMPGKIKTFKTKVEAESFAAEYESTIDGPKLPAEVKSLKRICITDFVGVYFLFKNKKCVYVGQSQNVHFRARTHRGVIDFDEYSWMPVPAESLDATEQRYIRELSPINNTMSKPKPVTQPDPRREIEKREWLAFLRGAIRPSGTSRNITD